MLPLCMPGRFFDVLLHESNDNGHDDIAAEKVDEPHVEESSGPAYAGVDVLYGFFCKVEAVTVKESPLDKE